MGISSLGVYPVCSFQCFSMDVSGSDASVKPFKDSVEHAIRVITRKGSAEK